MNFDNLVEDAKAVNADYEPECDEVGLPDCFHMTGNELKALITQYILADRAQGQEPVGHVLGNLDGKIKDFYVALVNPELPFETPLFTRAQPTPAQIAEIQAQTLEKLALNLVIDEIDGYSESDLMARALHIRKGEPL